MVYLAHVSDVASVRYVRGEVSVRDWLGVAAVRDVQRCSPKTRRSEI